MLCNKRTFWIFDPSLLLCNWLSMNIHIQKSSITRTEGKAKVVSTYSFRFLIREDAGLSTSCEITVNFERVPGTALVGINPVFTWMREEKGRKDQLRGHFSNLLTWDVSPLMGYYFYVVFENWSCSGAS